MCLIVFVGVCGCVLCQCAFVVVCVGVLFVECALFWLNVFDFGVAFGVLCLLHVCLCLGSCWRVVVCFVWFVVGVVVYYRKRQYIEDGFASSRWQ